jgi:hypothetical protein
MFVDPEKLVPLQGMLSNDRGRCAPALVPNATGQTGQRR